MDSLMELSDSVAVAQARAGDSGSFRVLVERHSRNLFHCRAACRSGTTSAAGSRWRIRRRFWCGEFQSNSSGTDGLMHGHLVKVDGAPVSSSALGNIYKAMI